MASASEVVQVSIAIKDRAAGVPSFSTILILASHTGPSGMRTYDASPDGLTAMVDDGIDTGEAAYRILQAIASQETTVETVKVFKRTTTNVQSVDLTPTITTEGYVYTLTLLTQAGTSHEITYTVPGSATVASICTALTALIDAITGIACADGTTKITLTPQTAGQRFWIKDVVRGLTILDASADAGIATDLAAAQLADPDWYGLVIDSPSKAEIVAAAAWVEANKKLFLANSQDTGILDSGVTTDVASTLKTSAYNRTPVIFSRDGAGYVNAGLLGLQFSKDPGSSNWAFKTIAGATVDNLTPTELNNAQAKKCNTYVPISGVNVTLDAFAPSGRYLDITHGIDWLEATMTADLLTLIFSQEKIPYTDVGVSLLESAIRGRLSIAETAGLISAGWTVTAPVAADAPTNDKAARILRNFKWNAVLQGAV
jgi:hypothetical protein